MTDGHIIPESRCPYCDHRFDRTAQINSDDVPSPGDMSVCIQCAGVLVFDEEMKLRRLNGKEVLRLAMDPELYESLKEARAMIRAMRAKLN